MKKTSGKLVSFSGIDGAGKSTIILHLEDMLIENYGLISKHVWCKFGAYPLSGYHLSRLFFFTKRGSDKSPFHMINKPSPIFKLYGSTLLACHLTQIGLLVKKYLADNQIVFCDRYIYDTMVDLQQDFNYSADRLQRIFSAGWIPIPDFRFLLDVPELIAMERKSEEISLDFLRKRRQIYHNLARKYQLTIIDSGESIDTVTQIVLNKINLAESRSISQYE